MSGRITEALASRSCGLARALPASSEPRAHRCPGQPCRNPRNHVYMVWRLLRRWRFVREQPHVHACASNAAFLAEGVTRCWRRRSMLPPRTPDSWDHGNRRHPAGTRRMEWNVLVARDDPMRCVHSLVSEGESSRTPGQLDRGKHRRTPSTSSLGLRAAACVLATSAHRMSRPASRSSGDPTGVPLACR